MCFTIIKVNISEFVIFFGFLLISITRKLVYLGLIISTNKIKKRPEIHQNQAVISAVILFLSLLGDKRRDKPA